MNQGWKNDVNNWSVLIRDPRSAGPGLHDLEDLQADPQESTEQKGDSGVTGRAELTGFQGSIGQKGFQVLLVFQVYLLALQEVQDSKDTQGLQEHKKVFIGILEIHD